MTPYVLLSVFLFSVCHALDSRCPAQENIAPLCICKDLGNGPMMVCKHMMSSEELVPPIKETENHDMFSLAIHDSALLYIPNRLFKNTYFKKIRLVATQLMSLAENDLAFEGLEDTLEEFRVMEAHYITQWSWSQLRDLQKLDLIDVDWVSLGSVVEPFPPLKSLTALSLSRADINFIVEDAFKDLENLRILVLKKNDISELSRSMFPNPASRLMILDLSDNKLNILPGDIFQGMPNLADLNLENNEFVTLNEAAFSPIIGTVLTLNLAGNNIRCDCRMRWIVDVKTPLEFFAECSQPENLRGHSLKYLVPKQLWC